MLFRSLAGLTRPLLCMALLFALGLAQRPVEAQWSSVSIGPDGPWQAVNVTIGSHTSVALYPGNILTTWVLTREYCLHNRTVNGCFASAAGTYDKDDEPSFIETSGGFATGEGLKTFSPGLKVEGPLAQPCLDSIDAGSKVSNVSMALLDDQMFAYPSGQWYPALAGCLGMGLARGTGELVHIEGEDDPSAYTIPGALKETGEIPSNSFGLHIGSVSSGVPGSLWWGGFDQSRIVGDVLTTNISREFAPLPPNFDATLKDIAIEVVDGSSPFNFTGKRQSGLLRGGDTTLPVLINGCSPYLSLPKATCDRIALHLPVTFNKALGLYLWNTEDRQYERIVSSASALAFTIQSNSDKQSEITIHVPFAHLDLTLTSPLMSTPTPYFPCFTGGPAEFYVLGRAFMQDAFVGANWRTETWWLAQAPGPSLLRGASATSIMEKDVTIKGSGEDWKATWEGAWKVLSEDNPADGSTDDSEDGGFGTQEVKPDSLTPGDNEDNSKDQEEEDPGADKAADQDPGEGEPGEGKHGEDEPGHEGKDKPDDAEGEKADDENEDEVEVEDGEEGQEKVDDREDMDNSTALSLEAKIGIGAGAGILLLSIIGTLVFIRARRRSKRRQAEQQQQQQSSPFHWDEHQVRTIDPPKYSYPLERERGAIPWSESAFVSELYAEHRGRQNPRPYPRYELP